MAPTSVDRPFVGNSSKSMPGTCEACVWGRGRHAQDCTSVQVFILQQITAGHEKLSARRRELLRDYDPIWQSFIGANNS